MTATPLGAGDSPRRIVLRVVGSGWDDADTGGTYTLEAGGQLQRRQRARHPDAADGGIQQGRDPDSVTGQDVDMMFRVAADKVAAGSNYYVYMVTRHNGGNALRPS